MTSDRSSIEAGLIELAKNFGHYFDDRELTEGTEDYLYICDPESYELLHVQSNNSEFFSDSGDWHNKKCYEFFGGKTAPCRHCPMKKVRHESQYVWTDYIPKFNATFLIKDILIDWNGKPAKLQTAVNINERKKRDAAVNEYLSSQNLLSSVIDMATNNKPSVENFEIICKEIGEYFDADRVIITDYCLGSLHAEWSKDNVSFERINSMLRDLQKKELSAVTKNLRYIWIDDVSKAYCLNDKIRNYWMKKGIRSMLMIPILREDELGGVLSLHNINAHLSEISVLNLISSTLLKSIYSHKLEYRFEEQLYIDQLTGALNYSGLKRRATELMKENPDTTYYIEVCDIRYFGGINRRFSFEVGDNILKETAHALARSIDSDEAFCRIVADQFCIMRKFESREKTEQDFYRFVEEMQCFDEITAAGVKIDYQNGVYLPPDMSDFKISQAVDKANIARRTLKDFHGSRLTFFCEEMLESSNREIQLIQDFKTALASNEITVYYQPQCVYSANKIAGAEALVRWISPKHGFVSPGEFIPLLERHGLIYELDRYVWEVVCKHQRKWIDMGCKCPISVNVSRYDVLRNGIRDELCSLLEKYDIPKELFPLEITETAYIKSSGELIDVVDMLKGAGFTVEMDDFGSGYSSLNALKDVAVDLLKLDMKFLDMTDSVKGRGEGILNCIVRMARWLNLNVLAEGVETQEQAEYLKSIGCDLMQGYYFAKPMPADEFEKMLLESTRHIATSDYNAVVSTGSFIEEVMSNATIFNHIGATAIVEYCGGECEALFLNDAFYNTIGCSREDYKPYLDCMQKYFVDNQGITAAPDMLDKLINGDEYCDFCIKQSDGNHKHIRMYCRDIFSDSDRHILLLTIDDITK